MLLVSSLDVFDCCGLELGGECPYSDPDRGDHRTKRLCCGLSSSCLPGNVQGQGTGAHWLTSRNTTNPSLAPSQEDRKMADKETKMLVPAGVWGASGHGLFCGLPTTCCKSILPLWALPGRIRSLASLQLSPPLLTCPGGLPQVSWQRENTWWKKRPGDGSSSPYPTSWVQPRGTLCAQTIETTSSVPRRRGLCEWLAHPHPIPSPSRGTEQWGRTRKPLTEAEKRESVLYTVLI